MGLRSVGGEEALLLREGESAEEGNQGASAEESHDRYAVLGVRVLRSAALLPVESNLQVLSRGLGR